MTKKVHEALALNNKKIYLNTIVIKWNALILKDRKHAQQGFEWWEGGGVRLIPIRPMQLSMACFIQTQKI